MNQRYSFGHKFVFLDRLLLFTITVWILLGWYLLNDFFEDVYVFMISSFTSKISEFFFTNSEDFGSFSFAEPSSLFSWQVLILHYDFLSQQTQDTVVLLRVVSVFFLSQVSLLPCFILQNVAHGRLMLIIPWVSRFHFLCIILHLLVSVVIYNQPFRIFLDMLPHSW